MIKVREKIQPVYWFISHAYYFLCGVFIVLGFFVPGARLFVFATCFGTVYFMLLTNWEVVPDES